ncbi:MAG TPA: PHP domain-containing protein [Pseudonocardiaceae bacterium]|nr:PHP domain-containing protein [Pseudonocardiaceae bacterium]
MQDGHVHTEWSWDTVTGAMTGSCERAIECGLGSIAFTEHADLSPWAIPARLRSELPEHFRVLLSAEGILTAPVLDVTGYLAAIAECRDRFPGLLVLSGVELSEPHWHAEQAGALVRSGDFDRVLGSVHALRGAAGNLLVDTLQGRRDPGQLVRDYLGEALLLAESDAAFEVLAHVDYPLRGWPDGDVRGFEEEFRAVLRALARSGRVLEVNTRITPSAEIVRWWHEAGGRAVAFGSDAHDPLDVARRFADAAAMVAAAGFAPNDEPHGFWLR